MNSGELIRLGNNQDKLFCISPTSPRAEQPEFLASVSERMTNDDILPQLGFICLQNYDLLNRGLILYRKFVEQSFENET